MLKFRFTRIIHCTLTNRGIYCDYRDRIQASLLQGVNRRICFDEGDRRGYWRAGVRSAQFYVAARGGGGWTSACTSSNCTAKRVHYARYYTFSLSNSAEVTIELTSATDPYLFVLSGSGKNGSKLYENDDIAYRVNLNSRISETLAAGSYTIEATTYAAEATGNFTLSVKTAVSTPTPTLTPTNTPTPQNTPTPSNTATATPTATIYVSAELEPAPDKLPDDREWFEFELDTSTSDRIIVRMNRSISTDKVVGRKTKHSGIASCTNRGAVGQGSNNLFLRDEDELYLAGCEQGNTTIELIWYDGREYHFLRTYEVEVVDEDDYYNPASTPTRTPSPTVTQTRTPTPSVTPTPTRTTSPSVTATKTKTPTPTVRSGVINTPTHTSSPTHTPTPDCNDGSSGSSNSCTTPDDPVCIQQLGSQSQGFYVRRRSQSWHSGCPSSRNASVVSIEYYAQYYTFTLSKASYVTIDLMSSESSPDSQLYLRAGRDETSIVPIASDAGSYPDGASGQGSDSRIVRQLPKGTYTIEATTANQSTTGNFSLDVYGVKRLPYFGHQGDHTVRYAAGTMLPTRTPVPTGSPTPDFPDPAVVIPTSVPLAVSAWNKAVSTPWPNVLFCNSGSNCTTRNKDGKIVLIDVIYIGRSNVSGAGDCGHAIACVKSGGVWADASGHLQKMTIVIEEPGLQFNEATRKYSRKIWTNDYTKHNIITPMGDRYIYLPVVMAHEFGHAAGLSDLYGFATTTPTPVNAEKYLMNNLEVGLPRNTRTPVTIPTADIKFMEQVYRNEGGSEPH